MDSRAECKTTLWFRWVGTLKAICGYVKAIYLRLSNPQPYTYLSRFEAQLASPRYIKNGFQENELLLPDDRVEIREYV